MFTIDSVYNRRRLRRIASTPNNVSGKKTLVSTGTKHLQEQLFHRDIPMVLEALGLSCKVSLLKGRSNYLCLHRLQQARSSSRRLDKKQLSELEAVSSWLPRSKSGDIGGLSDVPEDSRIWPQVTSTVDNCIGQNCSFFEDCFVNKARKAALASEVVVVNHHLFFADKALKNDGFGALLPDVDTVVFDEAHQIPDIASNFLGISFSSWQVMELANDTRAAELREKSLIPKLAITADELDKLTADYRLSLGLNERRVSWVDLLDETPNLPKKIQTLADKLCEFADARRTFRIHETPLDIGNELSNYFGNKEQARVFTSATLSIDGDFSHYQQLTGLDSNTEVATWDSPFDYFNQAVLYVPEGLPEPKDEAFSQALFNEVLPVLEASKGGAFVLFTSFRSLQQFEERMVDSVATDSVATGSVATGSDVTGCDTAGRGFTVLAQGDTSKRELLHSFVESKNPVLLGTMSFWEGVDVPGEALRCVIIDKLPFESPFEPVLKARLNAMQEAGDNPFMNYQVPRAVITLRQGAGRLIRSSQDKGVLMICDARLRRTHYGKIFLNSLPRMRRTSDSSKVCGYLNSLFSDETNAEQTLDKKSKV